MDTGGGATTYERELSALYSIAELLGTETDIGGLLERVLNMLGESLGMRRGMITIATPGSDELRVDIAPELSGSGLEKARYGKGEGITGRVIETGRPMAVPSLDEEPMFLDRTGMRRELDRSGLAFICVPVKYRDRVIGALSVDTRRETELGLDEEVRFLSAVADMLAPSVQARRKEQERARLERENLDLREELRRSRRPSNIIGNSRLMKEMYAMINRVADSNATVLITGETGTGKELVSAAIHESSPRKGGAFVAVNCAALPDNLLESELFGHEKGAFTGAMEKRIGRFEQANGGTIFLDEVGEMSPAAQVKLLRILQEQKFDRLGGGHTIQVNVRVIAATNRDLDAAVQAGEFRADLFYRLNVFPIFVPPLRERGADIMLLADYFAQKYAGQFGKEIRRINSPAIDALMAYHWPGNVRELENCIERAVLISGDGVIRARDLPPSLQMRSGSRAEKRGSLEEMVIAYERDLIIEALKYSGGNQSAAARELGTTKRVIQYKISKYDIDCDRFRAKRLG
ncbi:MAG TPA: sigma 54-interacting transcriptional regulator [bacterium]|nr:sigma 54-interacting transcriptional regulator [bacterium]